MSVLTRTVVIPAPAAVVWATLTDTARYGSWNPFITELSGELRPGARLCARIHPPGGRAMTFAPTVTRVEQGRNLEWLGRLGVPWIFDGRHSFTLEALDPARTRLVQAERFTGCLVPFTRALLLRTAAGFEAMNQAIATEATTRFLAFRSEDRDSEATSAT